MVLFVPYSQSLYFTSGLIVFGVLCVILLKALKVHSAHEAKAAQCEHLRAAVLFIKELEEAGVRLGGMLGSTTTSDVVEALRFFVTVGVQYVKIRAGRGVP